MINLTREKGNNDHTHTSRCATVGPYYNMRIAFMIYCWAISRQQSNHTLLPYGDRGVLCPVVCLFVLEHVEQVEPNQQCLARGKLLV